MSRKHFDARYRPHPEYRFWLYDPEGEGMTYYRTAQERDDAAEITIGAYLDDGWNEEVELVAAGEVTHSAQILDKQKRPPPEELDEEGYDGEGTHWPEEFEWRGNYKLEPIGAAGVKEPGHE